MTHLDLTTDQAAFELAGILYRTNGANKKLGRIYAWSLPAVETCPGATKYCVRVCYARKMAARRRNLRTAYSRNARIAARADFAQVLTKALSFLPAGVIRIHVSGDFHTTAYINAWKVALEANPHLEPFTYTRSWRIPALKRALTKAFKLEDGTMPQWLRASTDPETGKAPRGWTEATIDTENRKGRKEIASRNMGKDRVQCQSQVRSIQCDKCGLCGGFTVEGPRIEAVKRIPQVIVFAEHS